MSRRHAFVMILFALAIPLSSQPVKVACVGNSITYGSGISDRVHDSYPAHLQKLLGEDYAVLNAGNSGRTMLKKGDFPLWVEPEFKAAIEMEPDVVVFLLGTNDSKPQNWVFKDEFISDYIAMIDTFRLVNPAVQIYACLPPPAFSVQWGIRDSVITTDIIPMLRKIADSTTVDTIDFYQPFLQHNELFPDDIHPNAEGAWDMATIVYKAMTGNDVLQIQDVNLARKKPVHASSWDTCSSPEALVDGDCRTKWSCMSAGSAVVDLGAVESVDLFVTDFGEDGRDMGQYYKIEVSIDSTNWMLAVDRSALSDSSLRMAVDPVAPMDARYVKLTPLGPVTAVSESVGAFELSVYRTAPLHAPVLYLDDIEPGSRFTRFSYYVVPTTNKGYLKTVRSNDLDEPFTDVKGYRLSETQNSRGSVRPDKTQRYFTKAYFDGVEVLSADTLSVDWSISTVKESKPPSLPSESALHHNYPNPFNSSTVISYTVPMPATVELIVYNIFGAIVKKWTLSQSAGLHAVVWDGRDESAKAVASGLYYAHLITNGASVGTHRLLLLR